MLPGATEQFFEACLSAPPNSNSNSNVAGKPPVGGKGAGGVGVRNASASSVKIGTIQRRLAWPLRKDDTQKSRMYHFLVEGLDPGQQASWDRVPRHRSQANRHSYATTHINLIVRSYQGENVRSRPISETKHLWANSVLTWGTSWESLVLNVFATGSTGRDSIPGRQGLDPQSGYPTGDPRWCSW